MSDKPLTDLPLMTVHDHGEKILKPRDDRYPASWSGVWALDQEQREKSVQEVAKRLPTFAEPLDSYDRLNQMYPGVVAEMVDEQMSKLRQRAEQAGIPTDWCMELAFEEQGDPNVIRLVATFRPPDEDGGQRKNQHECTPLPVIPTTVSLSDLAEGYESGADRDG